MALSRTMWVVIILVVGILIVVGFAKIGAKATHAGNETTQSVLKDPKNAKGFLDCYQYCVENCEMECPGLECNIPSYEPLYEEDKQCDVILERSRA